MYKVLGFILIMAGCTGLGMWYSVQFRLHIRNLKQMCHILMLMEGQVRFGRSTLPECCMQIAQRVEEPFKSSLEEIYENVNKNNGSSFGQVSRDCYERKLKKLVVSEKEKEGFIACFANAGFEEDDMQIQNIAQERQELETDLEELNKSLASRCKLAMSLGTMSGVLLMILFL